MVDGGDAAAVPLTGLTGALIASLGSSGAPAPRRGAHFESLPRTLRPARLAPQIACAVNRCAGPRTCGGCAGRAPGLPAQNPPTGRTAPHPTPTATPPPHPPAPRPPTD